MTSGETPGFLTTLPIVALLGIVGSSVAISYCIRFLATRFDVKLDYSKGSLVFICLGAQLAILFTTGSILAIIGGVPAGPLLDTLFPTLFVVYGLPLVVVQILFGKVIGWRSRDGAVRRFQFLSSFVFGAIHLLMIPTVWILFVFFD